MNPLTIEYPLAKDKVISMLLAYDIQPTQQRVLVAEVLFAKPQHLSADQIKDTINLPQPSDSRTTVSKATVYNTLGLFAEKGLVNQVIVDPSRVFYDSNTKVHHHRYNIDTGELEDIAIDELEVRNLPQFSTQTEVVGIDVIVRVKNKPPA